MEYFKSALLSIRQNKGRSFLTMLGIIIGISSVITILAIGNGMKSFVNKSLDEMTSGSVTIQIDQKKTDKYLSYEQVTAIENMVPDIYGSSPKMTDFGTVSERYEMDAYVTGGRPVIQRDQTEGMHQGRFFREDDVESASTVCAITQESAILLFGTDDVLGKTLNLAMNGKSFDVTVVGIMKSSDTAIKAAWDALKNKQNNYYYCDLYVPYTLLTRKYGLEGEKIFSFSIYTHPGLADESALKVKSVVENMLELRGEGAVTIQSFASIASTYNNILNIVTLVVAFIAAISLLVGGIGVMNIMTVTVTERTREIGIRKSLGAKTSYIMTQFLTESAMITLIGGFIGIIMGWILTRIAGSFMSFPPVIDYTNVLLVVAISTADGLFFGIYPARKAAKLSPIEALRQE